MAAECDLIVDAVGGLDCGRGADPRLTVHARPHGYPTPPLLPFYACCPGHEARLRFDLVSSGFVVRPRTRVGLAG